jgi:hypothetical protein
MIISFGDGLALIVIGLFTVDDVKANAAKAATDTAVQVSAIENGVHPDYPLKPQ